jgi:hypothetical protein
VNGLEFAADLITNAYWPAVALTSAILFRKPMRSLIGRIRRGKAPGGWEIEADPEKASAELVQSVADAAEPASREAHAEQPAEGWSRRYERDVTNAQLELERRVEIEQVATAAAQWGQEMAEAMPPRPGSYWVPVFDWSDDGTVRLSYGRRVPDADGPGIVIRNNFGRLPGEAEARYWKSAPKEDAEGNDPRQS